MKFFIKRNDTSPRLKLQLLPPVDLRNATAVLNMKPRVGTDGAIVRAPLTIESVDEHIVSYGFIADETAVAGEYDAEVEVTLANGAIETYPNEGYFMVSIDADLG